jgi:methyl-accepting chemotaxis protein
VLRDEAEAIYETGREAVVAALLDLSASFDEMSGSVAEQAAQVEQLHRQVDKQSAQVGELARQIDELER